MNILTLCERGDNRSVIMASVLRNQGKYRDVISQGVFTSSQETLVMLYDWADKIIITTKNIKGAVHPEYEHKVVLCDMGDDLYGPNFNPLYREIALGFLTQI